MTVTHCTKHGPEIGGVACPHIGVSVEAGMTYNKEAFMVDTAIPGQPAVVCRDCLPQGQRALAEIYDENRSEFSDEANAFNESLMLVCWRCLAELVEMKNE